MVTFDDKLIACGSNKEVAIWNILTKEKIATLTDHTDWVSGATVTNEGELVTCGGDFVLRIWK